MGQSNNSDRTNSSPRNTAAWPRVALPQAVSRKRLRQWRESSTEDFSQENMPKVSSRGTSFSSRSSDFSESSTSEPHSFNNDYFDKFPERVLFGYILGSFDSDGLTSTMRLRVLCKNSQNLVDRLLNAVVEGDNGHLTSPQNSRRLGNGLPSRFPKDVDEGSAQCPLSPISVLRSDRFVVNTNGTDFETLKTDDSPIRIFPDFIPSLHANMGRKLGDLLNSENDSTDPVVPRRVWKWWIHSLNHIERLVVDEAYYECSCEMCREDPEADRDPDFKQVRIDGARRHAYLRFVLVLQILVRNRRTIRSAVIHGPARELAFNTMDDKDLPDIKLLISGLKNLDARDLPEADKLNDDVMDYASASDLMKDLTCESSTRWLFPKLESLKFSSSVDVRHAIPFIDGCSFPVLRSISFSWLEARYDLFPPQFGKLPIAVFAPNNLFIETRDSDAPHLPAIYNGRLDSSFKLDGLGMYSCPIYTYEGSFEAGLNSKYGKMRANTGETYEGLWHRGLRYGHGRVTQEAGCIMEGNWNDDLLHGIGYIVKPEGLFYLGQWFHSVWDGWGLFAYNGRLVAYGQFSHGLLHGWARVLIPCGAWEDSWWNRGKRICAEETDDNTHHSALYKRRIITCFFENKCIIYASSTPCVDSSDLPLVDGGYWVFDRTNEDATPLAGEVLDNPVVALEVVPSMDKDDLKSLDDSLRVHHHRSPRDAEHFYVGSPPVRSPVNSVFSLGASPDEHLSTGEACISPTVRSPVTFLSPEHVIYRRMNANFNIPMLSRQSSREFRRQEIPSTPLSENDSEYALRLIARINSPMSRSVSRSPGSTTPLRAAGAVPSFNVPTGRSWAESSSEEEDVEPAGESHRERRTAEEVQLFLEHDFGDDANGSSVSEWHPEDSFNESSGSDSESLSSKPVMAFSVLQDIAEQCDWSSMKVRSLASGVPREEALANLQETVLDGVTQLVRTAQGSTHVRYPPLTDEDRSNMMSSPAPNFLSKNKDGSLCLGTIHSMADCSAARPSQFGDEKIPDWLTNHLSVHYGISDALEPLHSGVIFNRSHAPFFSEDILLNLQKKSWSDHQENLLS
eukprot:GHVH01011764.1.p1 GENE.GHVH01011764.1~~GHVH01011764.1.p1  ORF type:complete len:1075 (-),score=163.09 GHVH01011764.1:57-3281(-)